MLIWARESLGMSIEEAAQAADVDAARLAAWEREPQPERPTIAQLRKLAAAFRRPLAAFFLPEPPREQQLVADFRRLPGSPREPSPELIVELRRAASRRDIALELAAELHELPPRFELDSARNGSPQAAAERIRARLGIDARVRKTWGDAHAALREWRRRIEDQGVLVFQISRVNVEETRGFSCWYEPLPVIAINSADAAAARVFTLAHELGHLVRRKGAACDLGEGAAEEVWCNQFAGELLVPSDELAEAAAYRAEWPDPELQRLARRFWVSQEVVLRRLVAMDRASKDFYERWRLRRLGVAAPAPGGPVPVPKRLVSSAGTTFVRLVLSAFHAELISASTLADYLGVKLKHLPAIEQLVVAKAS
jgi:Zn-dependent peptidase ImmA (M78 family)/DNA-binding XRE family transcriptional regulator